MTGGRVKIDARITPAIPIEPRHRALAECAGDDCYCKKFGWPIHPPLLMTFDPERGGYREASTPSCTAVWAVSAEGRDKGRHCAEKATHQVADVFVCEHHYRRMREWMNTRDQRDALNAIRTARLVHENQMRLDRERDAAQREDDRITAAQRAVLLKEEAKLQIELDRERLRAEEAARAEASRVYFVRRESDGLIKIGTSRTLVSRMTSLKREHGSLHILAVVGGNHKEEAALHRQFRELRAEGEWFRPELPLLEHVYALMKACPLEPSPGLPPVMERRAIGSMIRKIKMAAVIEQRRQFAAEKERSRLLRRQAKEAREAKAAAEPAA